MCEHLSSHLRCYPVQELLHSTQRMFSSSSRLELSSAKTSCTFVGELRRGTRCVMPSFGEAPDHVWIPSQSSDMRRSALKGRTRTTQLTLNSLFVPKTPWGGAS